MYDQSKKPQETKGEAVSGSNIQKKSNAHISYGFADNRPEATAQRKLQQMAVPSRMVNTSSEVIQKMAVGGIDKRHLWRKLRLEGIVNDFEKVNLRTCTSAQYKNANIPIKGITFPYESPPLVQIDISNIDNNDELAATIYHEVTHAYDPATPPKSDNSTDAKGQDIKNEVNTWRQEIEYSIRTGGQDLEALIADQVVITSPEGMLIPNPAKFTPEALRAMGYDSYDTEARTERFNVANYTFANDQILRPFGTVEEKHQYESEIQAENSRETHGELEEPMSEAVKAMYS